MKENMTKFNKEENIFDLYIEKPIEKPIQKAIKIAIEKENGLLDDSNVKELNSIRLFLQSFLDCGEISEIVKGGHGNLYKITHNNKKKAIKVFSKKKKSFYLADNEIRIYKKLISRHILSIDDELPHNDEYKYVLMDLSDNGDLEKLKKTINRSCFSESLTAYVNIQICKALKTMHDNYIVHFDIKPQNILIMNNLEIKLIDFSISYDYDKKEKKSFKLKKIGTYHFMAPEVLECKEIIANEFQKIDIWSLGITLYYLSFARFPFEINTSNPEVILQKIRENNLVFPISTNYSKLYLDFLSRCLEKDNKKRISIEEILKHEWIKASVILENELTKFCDTQKFLINLITDSILDFNNKVEL